MRGYLPCVVGAKVKAYYLAFIVDRAVDFVVRPILQVVVYDVGGCISGQK